MAKFIDTCPDWLEASGVVDIYSVSGCISDYFADYIGDWKHNDFCLFDSPQIIRDIAGEKKIDLGRATVFYYEIYEKCFDEDGVENSLTDAGIYLSANVERPAKKTLRGFDVVSFSTGSGPECSPLSCNGLAREQKVNRHCLFDTLEDAIAQLKCGAFKNSEPGPFGIFSVYTL